MNRITNESLEFLSEAKQAFKDNPDLFTYRDEEENFIALRTGLFDDSIMIYELGDEVGNFVEQLPRQRKSLVDSDDMLKYQDTLKLLETADSWMIFANPDYCKGYKDAIKFVVDQLKK